MTDGRLMVEADLIERLNIWLHEPTNAMMARKIVKGYGDQRAAEARKQALEDGATELEAVCNRLMYVLNNDLEPNKKSQEYTKIRADTYDDAATKMRTLDWEYEPEGKQ